MFEFFRSKKPPTIESLVRAYSESKLQKAELQDQISTIKADAVRSGKIDLDALQAHIDKIELRASLHDSAMAEIRSQLESIIAQQLADAQGEVAGRRAELESEMLAFSRQTGLQIGEALEDLDAIGQPYATKLAGQIRELITDVVKFEKRRPGCLEFIDGFTSVEPTTRNFKRELQQLKPPSDDPNARARKVQWTVDRLLGQERPNYQGGPGYLSGAGYYSPEPLPEHRNIGGEGE